jgi:hypothetical protein
MHLHGMVTCASFVKRLNARWRPPSQERGRATLRLSAETHRLLRIRVADADTNIQDWVSALIEETLEREPVDLGKRSWQRAPSRR